MRLYSLEAAGAVYGGEQTGCGDVCGHALVHGRGGRGRRLHLLARGAYPACIQQSGQQLLKLVVRLVKCAAYCLLQKKVAHT